MADDRRSRMAELIRRSPANYEYFFEHLDDPAWLRVLEKERFFRDPPAPERGEDWVRFPNWPESRYLVRIAAGVPEEVLRLAKRIPPTENPRVHEDILGIAAQLPGKMAAQLVRRESRWLRDYNGHLMSLPETAADALAHVARERETKAAFALASAILGISAAEEPATTRRRAVARVSEYSYGRIIERAWPPLSQVAPGPAFRFLRDRLLDVIAIGYTDAEDGYDSTSSWRSAIEDHAQNLDHSLLDLLTDTVRDQALDLAQTPDGLRLVLTELKRKPAPLLERIALHVIRHRGTADLVASKLADRDLAFDVHAWHEYGELLRHRYADLSPAQQARVLRVLDAGEERQPTAAQEARRLTAAELTRSDRYARLKRYVLIADHLDGATRDAYEALRDEFGEPSHPTFLSYMTSWSGTTSPFSLEDLRKMQPRDVARTLREWRPTGDLEDPSPEGLGRILKEVVAERSASFAGAAADFVGLEATYVRSLLDGLSTAARQGSRFPWAPVLDLAAWVVAQPRGANDARDDRQTDPHWGWARKEVAGLLSRGFADSEAELPLGERERVWSLLELLTEDPDPTPQHEERYGGDNMDPATLAINTTRGEALHAVVRYAFWVERGVEQFEGISSIREVDALLDRHLDLEVDPSLAVRSVYGQWFAQFVRIDEAWAAALAPRVFPADPEHAAHFAAAWNAYVVFNSPYTDVFSILHEAYALAVDRLDQRTGRSSLAGDPRKQLGGHLLVFRMRGEMEPSGDLLERFWLTAPTELRQEVLTAAGWSLEKTPSLPADVRVRLVDTWEWILEQGARSDDASLAGFGAWLGARALDSGWLLTQALAVLRRGVGLEPDFAVFRELPRLAQDHADETLELLRRMVLADNEGWSVHGYTDEVREMLRIALANADARVRRDAEAVVDLLGARGMLEFRDLVAAQ